MTIDNNNNKKMISIYNVTISETTKNRKIVVLLMDSKGCSEKRALTLLSKKNAVIATDLSLNEASKVKSKINKFGYGAEINKIKEINDPTEVNDDGEKGKIINDSNVISEENGKDLSSDENIRILEEKLAAAKELQRVKEEDSTNYPNNSNNNKDEMLESSNSESEKNKNKSFNLKFKFLVFIIAILLFLIIFLLLMVFAPSKEKLNIIDNSGMDKDEKVIISNNDNNNISNSRIDLLEKRFEDNKKKMSSSIDLLNSEEKYLNKFVSKDSNDKLASILANNKNNDNDVKKRTDKTIKSDIQMALLNPKGFFSKKYSDINEFNRGIDELEDFLLALEDESQRITVREKIKDLKRKILSKKRNIDEFMKKFKKIHGDVKFTGNKFIGNTNLPDNLKVTVKITKPDKSFVLRNKVLKNGKFSVKLNNDINDGSGDRNNRGIINKGDYLVDVNLRSERFQNDDVKEYIKKILSSNKDNSEIINKKISLAEDVLEKKLYYKISDVKNEIKRFILNNDSGSSNSPDVENSPTIEDESVYNLIIRDRNLKNSNSKEDRIKTIIKSCAATGFTMNNYVNEGKNLKIYFNNSKFPDFTISIEKCKEVMKIVDNNFNDKRFMDMILEGF